MANLIRYNPFNDVISLSATMDRLFEDSFTPRNGNGLRHRNSNLHETAEGFVLQIPLPGVNPDEVEITAKENTLSLKWETRVEVPEKATTHWSGFATGKYQQNFTLPAAINTENIEASYENGILTLSLPKAEHAKARTIKVIAK